jgi:predicted mannosyl-3-phosphoglycerate phosphatase (HAD superfamily)
MTTTPKVVIFTDLDGALLDRETYSFEPALPALRFIKEKKIPLIFVSSKTRAEIEGYRKKLKNTIPSSPKTARFHSQNYLLVRVFSWKGVRGIFYFGVGDLLSPDPQSLGVH